MGAKPSKRSVDITTTPKKEVLTEGAPGGDMKIEKLEEIDVKPTTNGVGPHADSVDDKDQDKDEANEKDQDKTGEAKSEETETEPTVETPAEGGEVKTPTETTPATPNTATPDTKETKKKEKSRKKWSFRSISFSRKDKNKPAREETPKNGHISNEEPLMEGGEENENAAEATTNSTTSPAEEKSDVVSPTESKTESVAEVKEEKSPQKPTTEAKPNSPVEAKKEEPIVPSPTAVPVVEIKKEEIVEKIIEAEKKPVEVSPVDCEISQNVSTSKLSVKTSVENTCIPDPTLIQSVNATPPSIIERKTSEDLTSQFPSSPPPTPIDPSPFQKAQQAAANASALAEALKVPAEVEQLRISQDSSSPNPPSYHSLDEAPEVFEENQPSPENPSLLEKSPMLECKEILSSLEETKLSQENITLNPIVIPVTVSEKEIPEPIEKHEQTELTVMDEEDQELLLNKTCEDQVEEMKMNDEIVLAKPAYVIPVDGIVENIKSEISEIEDIEKSDLNNTYDLTEKPEDSIVENLNEHKVQDVTLPPPPPETLIPSFCSVRSNVNEQSPNDTIPTSNTEPELKEETSSLGLDTYEFVVYNEDLPPAPETTTICVPDLNEYPLPPDDLPCPPYVPSHDIEIENNLPLDSVITKTVQNISEYITNNLLDSPEIPLTYTNESNIGTVSPTNNTNILSYVIDDDEQNNRDSKIESITNNPNSLKDLVSHKQLTDKDILLEVEEKQEEPLMCQMSKNDCKSTAIVQENHQKTQVSVVLVDTNAKEVITENGDDPPKIPPPAIPIEIPIVTPSAPVITEDVASVIKAIEEIEISDKAVAAAVNEAMESNDLIADGHHQNDMIE